MPTLHVVEPVLVVVFGRAGGSEHQHRRSHPVLYQCVASRLLKSELNMDFARIEIYPTNQYTPAVHRLLQVTANIFDAGGNYEVYGPPGNATNFPSVFRPLFFKDPATTNVFIVGYTNIQNATDEERHRRLRAGFPRLEPSGGPGSRLGSDGHGGWSSAGHRLRGGFPQLQRTRLDAHPDYASQRWNFNGNEPARRPYLDPAVLSNFLAVEGWKTFVVLNPYPLQPGDDGRGQQ